jgi:S-adenosylmethionine uptake transporter
MKPMPTQNLIHGGSLLAGELTLTIVIASIVKLLEPQIPIFQILLCRYLFCLPLLMVYGRITIGSQFLKVTNTRILLLRTVCGFMGLCMWYLAIATINISSATVLLNTMPLFITLLSALIARESVGIRRTLAVIFGFVGVLIILFPLKADFNLIGSIYALLGALFSALMFVFIRMLGKSDASVPTAIWYNTFGALASGILCLFLTDFKFTNYSEANIFQPWLLLILTGILASFQQFFLAESHQHADASALAPLHYLSIPLGVFFGFILFGDVITIKFVFGTLIIIVSTFYIFVRQRSLSSIA